MARDKKDMVRKNIQIPKDLAEIIGAISKQEHRSFPAQVVHMLSEQIKKKDASI